MLIRRFLNVLFCSLMLLSPLAGCGTSVDSSPATGETTDEGASSTDGMTEEEAAEFEAGEGGA